MDSKSAAAPMAIQQRHSLDSSSGASSAASTPRESLDGSFDGKAGQQGLARWALLRRRAAAWDNLPRTAAEEGFYSA